MIPELLSADDRQRAPDVPFRLGDFRRVLAFLRPLRSTLLVGLLFTILFASFHTASISGAFPVFKILLEDEGLRGWADRVVAGERLGVEFTQPADTESVEIARVTSDGPGHSAELRPKQSIADPAGRPIFDWLHEIAHAADAEAVSALVDPYGQRQFVKLTPARPELHIRALRWAASWVPGGTREERIRALAYVLAALVVTTVIANAFRYFGEVLIAKAVLKSMMGLRAVLYERTLRLPMSFFSGQPTADIVTRFVQDIQEIQRGLITLFGKFIREPLRAVFILSWALLLDWQITLTMALATPVAVAIFWWVGRSVKAANKKLLRAYGIMIGALTTTLQNLRVVKAYTAEAQEEARLDRIDRGMFRQQLRLAKLDAFVSPVMETVAVVAGSFVAVWLLSRVLNHQLSLSKFASLGAALSILFDPLRKLSDVWVRIQRAVAAGERIFQVIDMPGESEVASGTIELGSFKESVVYSDVTFTYPGATHPALNGVNLNIQKGETVAIVGPNGSGKTTLVSMLLRLFDPDRGEIRYDGIDLRQARLDSLRRQIGLVTQEAVVFAGTPAENIAYGMKSRKVEKSKSRNPALENGRVQDAAKMAFADEFIQRLPGGYGTLLGEQGTTLSGGQRQRLAIARAVHRDAPILIFDEATSQIDSESERKIQAALQAFSRGRTTLIVAHRLSTIQCADRIIVMDAGRIIDQGTHADLYIRCPLYRTLCDTQFVTAG